MFTNPIFILSALAIVAIGASGGSVKIQQAQKKARGLRNNNPLNIRIGDEWQGKVGDDGAFVTFSSPEYGIRAATRIFRSYQQRGIVTLEQIVSTWAPAVENDVGAYVSSVEQQTGFSRHDAMLAPHYPALIAAMIKHENGSQPYAMEQIVAGIALA